MSLNYDFIILAMLFMILISMQSTLNKIYVILKEIKEIINLKKIN